MESIYLPQLAKAIDGTQSLQVKEFIPDLETLTPVQGWVKVVHQGDYLDVSSEVQTIVTLGCDRCLQQYNHRLSVKTSELIWFESSQSTATYEPGTEIEVALDDLIETIAPDGYFDVSLWLYEQLCLERPLQTLCDVNCVGIEICRDEQNPDTETIDHRWAALESIKHQL